MAYYNLRGKSLDFVPELTSREDIENVDLEEGRLLKFNLRVKSIGEIVKVKTAQFGAKDFLEIILVGHDPSLEIKAEAWSTHASTFLKLCGTDTVFSINFHAKSAGNSMFAEVNDWRIRLNSEVKIKDIEKGAGVQRRATFPRRKADDDIDQRSRPVQKRTRQPTTPQDSDEEDEIAPKRRARDSEVELRRGESEEVGSRGQAKQLGEDETTDGGRKNSRGKKTASDDDEDMIPDGQVIL